MNNHPFKAIDSFIKHRELIGLLTKRDIQARYRGALMGSVWLFIQPLLMLAVYTLVFKYIFGARLGIDDTSGLMFAQSIFAGMIIHGFAAEVISLSPSLVLRNTSYVKKVTFPLEVLSWIKVKAALTHSLFSFLILLIFLLVAPESTLTYHLIYLPLIIFPYFLFLMGICWIFSALGVYFRDLDQLTDFLTRALLFLSPVFYTMESTPSVIRPLINLNPLTLIIEQTRGVLINHQTPDFIALGIYYLFGITLFSVGFLFFSKLRRGFADVM